MAADWDARIIFGLTRGIDLAKYNYISMQLTLYVPPADKSLLKQAKRAAKTSGTSISSLFMQWLREYTAKETR
jgi:hypothetical protein